MPLDAEAMAASVVLAIKTALVPVQAKVLALNDQVIGLEARLADLNLLRERMAVVETKSATVNLLEKGEKGDPGRDGVDGKDGMNGRDVDMEHVKSLVLGELSTWPRPKDGDPGRDGKDGKDGAPGVDGKDGRDGLDGKDGAAGLNGKDGAAGLNGHDGEAGKDVDMAQVVDLITKELGTWPRPMNGLNGRDGTLENVKIVQLDDRTWQWQFKNGDPIDGGLMHFDVELYRGVWLESKTYERGDCTTWGGSEWHCNETTTMKPGEGTKAWTLKVKRGRDGRDGKDAMPALSHAVVKTR
jgi:integrin beta 3